jgi:hypothetical protein
LLHGLDIVAELSVLLPELFVVNATPLGGLRHVAGLRANAVSGLRACVVLPALLIGCMDALALLVTGALGLAWPLPLLAAPWLPHGGRTLALHPSVSSSLPATPATSLGIQHWGGGQHDDRCQCRKSSFHGHAPFAGPPFDWRPSA